MKQQIRHTIKQVSETTLSETCNLETLKMLFPYDWKKKVKEIKKLRFIDKNSPWIKNDTNA